MKIIRRVVVFDARDIEAESRFWAGLLGGTVHRNDDWHSIVIDSEWIMSVQLAPNHLAPDWPTGPTTSNRCTSICTWTTWRQRTGWRLSPPGPRLHAR